MDSRYVILVIEVSAGNVGSESLWAVPEEHAGETLYRVQNIPIFADEINYLDLVRGEIEHEGDEHDLPRVRFVEVAEAGGHETLTIGLKPGAPDDERQRIVTEIEAVGCGAESGISGLMGVDMPPGDREAMLDRLEAVLEAAHERGVLLEEE